jgi:hypothetical protein
MKAAGTRSMTARVTASLSQKPPIAHEDPGRAGVARVDRADLKVRGTTASRALTTGAASSDAVASFVSRWPRVLLTC